MATAPSSPDKICLFGGTFDPIHLGHTHIATVAVQQLGLDRVIFLPCRQSPHKEGLQPASAEARLSMCQLATEELRWAEVDDMDLTSPPPSYSWRTAEAMAARFSGARLFWLMGTDQWQALPRWSQSERLANLVEFIVFSRGAPPEAQRGFRMHAIDGHHPASASLIRQAPNGSNAQQWLHPKVSHYLESHSLYQSSPDSSSSGKPDS